MSLTDEMLKKIKEEINNDPEGLGYLGKSDKEIMNLLNNNFTKPRIVLDEFQSPIHRILIGIADTPNVVTEAEVSLAKTK